MTAAPPEPDPKAGAGPPLRIPDGPRHQPYPHAEIHPTDVLGSFFLCGLAFLLLAAIAGVIEAVEPWERGRWLALHLAFFGGVSQLILGATQFFAGAFLATDPPPRRQLRFQLVAWNLGTVLLAVFLPLDSGPGVALAVALLAAGLLAWAASLRSMKTRSLNRNPWATRWYEAAAVFFCLGIAAGGWLAEGSGWTHGYLTGAHMILNLGGWFGTTIVGTLHTFYPTLTRSRLRFPRLQPPAFWLWSAGIVTASAGYAFNLAWLAGTGWLALTAAACLLLANVIACRVASGVKLTLAARLVGLAQAFLPAGLLLLAAATFADGPVWSLAGETRAAAGTLLVAGWVGLTVIGSLLHLLVILVRARDYRRPVPEIRPVSDRVLAGLSGLSAAGLAVSQLAGVDTAVQAFRLLLLLAYLLLACRVAIYASGVLRHARPGV